MPSYTVTDPQSGRKVTLTGDSPPTEQELEEVFSSIPGAKADFSDVTSSVQTSEPSMMDKFRQAGEGVIRGDHFKGAAQGIKQSGLGLAQLLSQGGAPGVAATKLAELMGIEQQGPNVGNMASEYLGNIANESQQQFDMTQAGQNWAGKGGQIVGETAPAMMIPGGQATLPARLGMAGVGGMAAGAMQPVTQGNFVDEKLQQMETGAATGVLGQGFVGEPLSWGAGKVASLLSKDVQPAISDSAKAAKQYADENNLPIYYDDLTNSSVARKAGTLIDDIPYIGGGGSRAAQEKAARAHAEGVVGKYETASSGRSAETIAQSADDKLAQAKLIKNKLYRKAFDDLNKSGDFELKATKAEAARMIQIEKAKGKLADAGLIRELEKYKGAPSFNFENWHGVRSDLGKLIRSKQTGENSILSDRA